MPIAALLNGDGSPTGITATGVPTTTRVDGTGFSLRHIRPGTGEGASTVTLLGRAYGFEWLPTSTLPHSPDLVEGTYTTRLGDAGEFTLSFPNVASSKGLWRDKFSEAGCLEFIEIYRDGHLEFVGCIERVEIDRGTVTISGGDGFSLLKRAYERDRTWWHSPVDVVDHYTQVPVPGFSETWDDATAWSTGDGLSPAANPAADIGRFTRSTTSAYSEATFTEFGSGEWTAQIQLYFVQNLVLTDYIDLHLIDTNHSPFHQAIVRMFQNRTQLIVSESGTEIDMATAVPIGWGTPGYPYDFRIWSLGGYVRASINGRELGALHVDTALLPSRLRVSVTDISAANTSGIIDVGPISTTYLSPFLRRGDTRGTLALPSDQPNGGLRGNYYNIGDVQGLAEADRSPQILAVTREPYAQRLDQKVDTSGGLSLPVQPGAASTWFAVRWTGSVWLPAAAGDDIEFRVASADDGVRLWVGDTRDSEPLLDSWVDRGATATVGPVYFTASDDEGWFPLRLEFYTTTGGGTLQLQFRRVTSGWTDPGGTSITANTWTTIPATSLSPLGCHEGRIQGQSHFSIIQDAASQAGYELLLEPMSLESGEFPGRLIPKHRVGRDTDVLLEVEDRDDAEPILQPAVTRDSSDQAVRFIGAGSGNADGRGSQTIAEVADPSADALFELQAWADAGDATLPQLLEARLNAELALRSTPWEEVRGNPRAFERLADTWPLTGTLSAMRWRPGDGLRISVPDIDVLDADPRRLTQVTRTFMAEGRTGTTVGFRQRPRSATVALRGLARSRALMQRSFQGRPVTLQSNFIDESIAASAFTDFAIVPLQAQDRVLRAYARIVLDDGDGALELEINATDRTSDLGGGWATQPVEVDITAYATQRSSSDNRLYARVGRPSGGTTGTVQFQLIVEVLRR